MAGVSAVLPPPYADYGDNCSVLVSMMEDEVHVPSPDEVEAARTPAGGWTKKQLAQWGVPWPPPKGWRERLCREWQQLQE